MSNYPEGVTDAHPHFNPSERPTTVDCTSDECKVVPTAAIKDTIAEIGKLLEEKKWTLDRHRQAVDLVAALQFKVDEIERESDYECQWVGELELPVSEDAQWTCPRCGSEQTTDTLPDEDPDRDYEDYRDSRYDD
jgi:hypothetical protein